MAADPQADPREFNPLQYWKRPEPAVAKGLTEAYWDDPRPDLQGMLTAEHIWMYQEAVGRMIRPFDPDLLKAASYELTLGSRCLVEGEEMILTERNPRLIIKKNSIAFVSMQQVLCLPHYIVGRFDLAINFIYQGLLLGTGPQVDPGFQGALGCPLHNISNQDIEMRLGEPFAKIDFVKTAPRDDDARAELAAIHDEKELEAWLKGRPHARLFKKGVPQWREPIFAPEYLGGRRPKSSVAELYDRLDRLQRFGLVGLVSVLLSAGALVGLYVQSATDRLASKDDLQRAVSCQRELVTLAKQRPARSPARQQALAKQQLSNC